VGDAVRAATASPRCSTASYPRFFFFEPLALARFTATPAATAAPAAATVIPTPLSTFFAVAMRLRRFAARDGAVAAPFTAFVAFFRPFRTAFVAFVMRVAIGNSRE